jgi:type IV pilus assembly protein PilF
MGTTRGIARHRRWLAAAAAAGSAVIALGGCASTAQDAGGGTIITASDESEGRRRARIRTELAGGYFEQGKVDIALDEIKQAIAADPGYAQAYNLRGLVFMRLNDNRQAEESFKRAISLNSRDSDAQHNYGWLLCQSNRYPEAQQAFDAAMVNPLYPGRAKTLMAMGVCQARAGRLEEAERSLARSYELDAANPVTGYNLANLLYRRGDAGRSQFYIRRLNNSDFANAETLWLGIKVERRLNDAVAMRQLGEQLKKRYPQSREAAAFDRGSFDE